MKDNCTRIAVILDRSGSMQSLAEATVAGFNAFIDEQKKLAGECSVRLIQFDDKYEVVFDKPLQDVSELTQAVYLPRGTTALLDAEGRTILELGEYLTALKEEDRPSKVIVLILTDGLENASTDFTLAKVAALIKQQRETYGWEFIYLGANQDAGAVAATMNIPRGSTMTYNASPQAMGQTIYSASNYVRATRAGTRGLFSDEDRKNAMAR